MSNHGFHCGNKNAILLKFRTYNSTRRSTGNLWLLILQNCPVKHVIKLKTYKGKCTNNRNKLLRYFSFNWSILVETENCRWVVIIKISPNPFISIFFPLKSERSFPKTWYTRYSSQKCMSIQLIRQSIQCLLHRFPFFISKK